MTIRPPAPATLITAAPALFVLLWSTGFIGMRLGSPFAEPFTFMLMRMIVVVTLFGIAAKILKAPWPAGRAEAGHIAAAGLLTHATYLCGVLFAISLKLPVGYIALIAGMQPVFTSLFAHFLLGEELSGVQWAGMALGLGGVVIVVASKNTAATVSPAALGCAAIGLFGITAGTLYQKRFCSHMDICTGGIIQYAATGLVLAVLAPTFETMQVQWTGQFIFALAWLSIMLSMGAITLLYLMIRRGAASKVASLFFLTPSVTALLAWLLFGEMLTPWAIAGMVVTAAGVALVMRARSAPPVPAPD